MLSNMFYQIVVFSVMTFAFVSWGGNAMGMDMDKLIKSIKKTGSCVGEILDIWFIILEDSQLRKAIKIEKDECHPLNILMLHRCMLTRTRVKYDLRGI